MREIIRSALSEHRPTFVRMAAMIAIVSATICSVFAADGLTRVPVSQQQIAERICLPVQYQQGSDAYRACLSAEITARESLSPTSDGQLPLDEQYAVQRACASTGAIGSPAQQNCIEQQISLLNSEPAPQWQSASTDEQHVIQQACADIQRVEGGQAYRRCVNEALDTLGQLPGADLSDLSFSDRNTLQQACLGSTNDARDYRQCLLDKGGKATPQPVSAQPVAVASDVIQTAQLETRIERDVVRETALNTTQGSPQIAVQNDAANPETRLVAAQATSPESPQLDDSVSSTLAEAAASLSEAAASLSTDADGADRFDGNNASNTGAISDLSVPAPPLPAEALASVSNIEPERAEIAAAPSSSDISAQIDTPEPESGFQIANVLKNLQTTLNDLSGTDRLLTVAALALPLVMIISWLIFRRREDATSLESAYGGNQRTNYRNTLDPDVSDEQKDSGFWLREQADDLFDTKSDTRSNSDDQFSSAPASMADPMSEYEAEPTVKIDMRAAKPSKPDAKDQFDELFESAPASDTHMKFEQTRINSSASGEFGRWLNLQPEQKKLSFAIEFLIYWLAYADDRYEPSLRARVFKMQDPDDHTQIKRWVLQKDIYSFSDAVRWIQANAVEQQRLQIIDLLIALLVSEKALTPIQNTLFRFLGDAFGLGQVKLDIRFRRAFDYSLPQLPRVDKPVWWQSQSEEQRFRWNARAVARQPAEIQHRVKLGLPLTGELQPADIAACYQRAAARCHPKHFQKLGERELHMVERQLAKFEAARDSLLESIT